MKNKIYIKPTKFSLRIGIIVAIAMFIFGLFFLSVLNEEGAQIGVVFMAFWLFVMLVIAGTFTYNLVNYDKNAASISGVEMQLPDSMIPKEKEEDFDLRLRKIEKLKSEGLISEEEYTAKRKDIMNEKW